MFGGYTGKMAFVDLSSGEVREKKLDEALARDFIGGYGMGVRVLYEHQRKGIDPLGPESTIGFTTGPLTGTKAPTGGRYMVVGKSPLTGGWGDANSGGYFGSELKAAGWDAVFVSGVASSATYVLIRDDQIVLRDASRLWGMDTVETERALRRELKAPRLRVACIGPASEKLSLISGIVNDGGRIAARSGLGAVMGSKRLKAVAVQGTGRVRVVHEQKLEGLRKSYLKTLRQGPGFSSTLTEQGTCGITKGLIAAGATPIKNWLLAGEGLFPGATRVSDVDPILRYQIRKYGCANCPIACGGLVKVTEGSYPVDETHKPEYETIASFGPLCMNEDPMVIFKLNDMCNRSGLDTISAGSVIAFAMECFEKGILTTKDTDGIDLKWGDSDAMVTLLQKIIRREGIGDALADGVKVAARKIGKAAGASAIHVGGQEPGMHNALFLPGRGTGYVSDPTPGRHTATPMARIDAGMAGIAPYEEMQFHGFERYEYRTKGPASAKTSCYWQVGTCAGLCLFPVIFFGNYPLLEFFNAVTGREMNMQEALKTGARIQSLRQYFNIREGIKPEEIHLPSRMLGIPPHQEGPLAGITIDLESLRQEYFKSMGWDSRTGVPLEDTLKNLNIRDIVHSFL
jgi:aldehyde:ferredoxin oxidoreductase